MSYNDYSDFIKRKQAEAKTKGMSVSQMYLREVEPKYRKIAKQVPYLWKAVMGRKYLLPQHRQQDYVNQDVYSYLMLDSLITIGRGIRKADAKDDVMKMHYVSYIQQIEHDRPIYFLEKELAGPMMRQRLPDDFLISDIHWKWPSFRVYLPKGILTFVRDAQVNNVVYLDLMRMKADEKYTLPPDLKIDLWTLDAFFNPAVSYNSNGFIVNGNLDVDDPDSSIGYSGTSKLDDVTVKKLMEGHGSDLNPTFKSDELDNDLVRRMLRLGLNILMTLSSYPVEYETKSSGVAGGGDDVVRKARKEGDRTIPALVKAKFVGAELIRAKKVEHGIAPHLSGYEMMAQWRSGHWKRVWYGPKKGQHKQMWIEMYGTKELIGVTPPEGKV